MSQNDKTKEKAKSRYENIRKRREKILELIGKHNALSTKMAHELLTKEGFRVNYRTVQRDFEELQVEGRIIVNPSVGREQTYSLVKVEKSAKPLISAYLLNSLWKEIRKISHIAVYGRTGVVPEPEEALNEMRLLIARLPKPLKDKIKPLERKLTQAIVEIEEKREKALKEYRREEADELYEEYRGAVKYAVLKLVDELSNMLHDSQA